MSIDLFEPFTSSISVTLNRIEQLKQFINDDPGDVFSRYALALEYLKVDPAVALKFFDELIATNPDYLPSYYPAAHLMIELNKASDAMRLFEKGIALAKEQGNPKMEMELKAAYDVWKFERDD